MSMPSGAMAVAMRCAGCGYTAPADEPYPFRCPRGGTDDVDHVMTAAIDPLHVRFPAGDDPNPFVRYSPLSYAHAFARAHGFSDSDYSALVHELDREVERVDGRGFRVTPLGRSQELSDAAGFGGRGGIFIKDETGNVSGSHKGRHLMGLLIHLSVVEQVDLAPGGRRELAIASCGNAALAAGVLAHAAEWPLLVFVPPEAPPSVVARLRALEANVVVCPRDQAIAGDPTYHRLQAAVRNGAIPFTCQGSSNGLTIDGGKTLGYEMITELLHTATRLDRVFIQVGGGALASAVVQAFQDAVHLGVLPRLPRIHTVQTERVHPLSRAYDRLMRRLLVHALPSGGRELAAGEEERANTMLAHAGTPPVAEQLAYAASHRHEFMWPWEEEPHSIASGILDDETYDWLAVVRGMVSSGGYPVLVSEELLAEANTLAARATGIHADETGTAGFAGLLALRRRGQVRADERVAVLFTGMRR